MNEKYVLRLVCIVLAFFPALWGVFGFLNNVAGFEGTSKYAVEPMLAMTNTYGNPWINWRAITFSGAADFGLVMITFVESLAGIFAFIGIYKMLINFKKDYSEFAKGKIFVILGALFAVMVWGLGFMVIAGDWFMSWQAKENPLNNQIGGLIYSLPCMITILTLMLHKEEI